MTDQATAQAAASLVLSLFPGIDLLGRGFESEGFCVVRGPDLIWGQSIESFHVPASKFEGVIAGSPCQDFSLINRTAHRERGEALLAQFARVVTEAKAEWWLLENVPTVPTLRIDGYKTQRLDLRASECGLRQSRLRHFQFGSSDGRVLIPNRESPRGCNSLEWSHNPVRVPDFTLAGEVTLEPCCLASEGKRQDRRSFADFCELQGLPRDFDLPGWSRHFKYRAVGNGVPVPMARVIAQAVCFRRDLSSVSLCICGCGRLVTGRRVSATPACRKRMQRRRDGSIADDAGGVTLL